ncbi:Accessory gene regulator protein C [Lactobacillus equicursoris DSM 19284 = JCM 14600 = CIP 110162]|uniref:Signal transduction protein n=1 Tax=Lactobacillus equicursoris DSM 19284 = JCM 14600 = CIP 110162 TaxID=1293597 RepID=K0NK68_9LACO|nr:GHKL domain-containing protein [Lactobacillus equicursoris]KRL01627.1 signal transduction protein [Lactobacillus equicursoris DSM 19284 = JCM 14600 = CIP 110162]CCK85642.1 Accessory gene regulator protein C [Lactobacillus equicursoris DSM 19284 = JCM 14600 = CIP 110162]
MIASLFNNYAFNPYLFAVLLSFTLDRPKRFDLILYPLLLIPVLFGYQYVLVAIIAVQLGSRFFARGRVKILDRLFFYYLVLILYPILGELFGWLVQLLSYFLAHRLLDHLAINLVCFIPEVLICLLVYFLKKHFALNLEKIAADVKSNHQFLNLLVWIVWSFLLVTYAIWTMLEKFNIAPLVELGLMTIVLLMITILFFNLYQAIQENQEIMDTRIQKAEIQQIQEYSTRLEEANIALRKARHDYKNSLLALNGYLLTDDVSGAREYLGALVDDNNRLQEAANSMTLELANLQIKELKYLIIDKLQQAQDQGIQTKVEINKRTDSLPTNIVSIIRCVGIFLDNAIEACQSQANAKINVLLTKYSGNSYSLIVQNTISQPVNLARILKPRVTSKQDHDGLGLDNVNEIVNSDPDLSLEIEQSESEISFELIIQKGADR